ncbi:DUF5947 family protein [Allosalinactinospora lopnorensis]|uniref:DUF5947 family protein n=1 Tax=Allosalinactinospora lopnorensis TaxID=1352348 RepID=UPI000623C1C3|nr:DUF5947 family protein [Allosalinactinospora lopnorensis]
MSSPVEKPPEPAGLRRFLKRGPSPVPGEQCEMCAEPLHESHSHVADLDHRSVLCACRACHLLFTTKGAAGGRYLSVPERYLHDPGFPISDAQWDALQIPVRMVFFLRNSDQGRTVALYPSPAGATESTLPLDTAAGILDLNPAFADLADDVEALLLHRREDAFECFLLPVDACYRLVGLVRMRWKGFDGGEEAWTAINGFFADLRERCRSVGIGARGVRR